MKKLFDYIAESLSDENLKKLEAYINDDNIDDVLKVLKKHISKSGVNVEEYEKFFKKHGIYDLNWGRKNSAIKQFVELFNENDNLETLNKIIDGDGVISVKSMPDVGNIFNYCKEFDDEAKTIATWTNSKSANAGPCEMLLKFILNEGGDKGVGDVGIRNENDDIIPSEEMEVKAATLGNKGGTGSGGHPVGQKRNNGSDTRKAWAIYHWLNNKLLKIETTNAQADKLTYFQNLSGINDFGEKCTKANLSQKEIARGIVNAICFQYNFITNDDDNKNTLDKEKLDALYDATEKYLHFNKGFNYSNLLNTVGCIQLYLYSQVEQFDYFICVLIDKNPDSTNEKNGFYVLFKECNSPDTRLLKFDEVTTHIKFGTLDSSTTSQGRTGKMTIKK